MKGVRFLLIRKSFKASSCVAGSSALPTRKGWLSNWMAKQVKPWRSPRLQPKNWNRLYRLWDAFTDRSVDECWTEELAESGKEPARMLMQRPPDDPKGTR